MAYHWKVRVGSFKTDSWSWCTQSGKERYSDAFVFILGGNVLTYGCYYFSGKKDENLIDIYPALYDIKYMEFSVLFFHAAGGDRTGNAPGGSYGILDV